jgi:hypothetical protein
MLVRDTARAMSQESVEIVRRGMEPFNQHFRNPEVDLSAFAADLTVDNLAATFDGKIYRGHDGLREWLSLHRGMWKHQRTEPQEFLPVGDGQVVVPIRIVSTGRDDVETVAHAVLVMTVRERKIAYVKGYQSKAEALAAVGGLPEQDARAGS